jgi:hypothetical protein
MPLTAYKAPFVALFPSIAFVALRVALRKAQPARSAGQSSLPEGCWTLREQSKSEPRFCSFARSAAQSATRAERGPVQLTRRVLDAKGARQKRTSLLLCKSEVCKSELCKSESLRRRVRFCKR